MNTDELLREIDTYTNLLLQNACIDLKIERVVLTHESTAKAAQDLSPALRARQREYAIMLRKMEKVKAVFLAGGEWLSIHRELWSYKKDFDARHEQLDAKLRELLKEARTVN